MITYKPIRAIWPDFTNKENIMRIKALAASILLTSPAYAGQVPPDWAIPPNHSTWAENSWHLASCFLWGASTDCITQDYNSWDECAAAYAQILVAKTKENKPNLNIFGACTQR